MRQEYIWVTEVGKGDNGEVLGRLINEPHSDLTDVHMGDVLQVVPLYNEDGSVTPMAIMPWMKDLHWDDLFIFAANDKIDCSVIMERIRKIQKEAGEDD